VLFIHIQTLVRFFFKVKFRFLLFLLAIALVVVVCSHFYTHKQERKQTTNNRSLSLTGPASKKPMHCAVAITFFFLVLIYHKKRNRCNRMKEKKNAKMVVLAFFSFQYCLSFFSYCIFVCNHPFLSSKN